MHIILWKLDLDKIVKTTNGHSAMGVPVLKWSRFIKMVKLSPFRKQFPSNLGDTYAMVTTASVQNLRKSIKVSW